MSLVVWDDDQEELNRGLSSRQLLLGLAAFSTSVGINVLSEVRVDGVLEVFNGRLVVEGDDVSVVDEDLKPVLL